MSFAEILNESTEALKVNVKPVVSELFSAPLICVTVYVMIVVFLLPLFFRYCYRRRYKSG